MDRKGDGFKYEFCVREKLLVKEASKVLAHWRSYVSAEEEEGEEEE